MYAGRIVESGSVNEVFLSPNHPYTQGLLESMPSRSRRGERLRVIKGRSQPLQHSPGVQFRASLPTALRPLRRADPLLGDPDEEGGSRVACWLWMDPPRDEPAAVGQRRGASAAGGAAS